MTMSRWWPALAAAAVVLVTILLGLLSNWWKVRPAILAPPVRYRTVFASAVIVAVGLAVVQAVVVTPEHQPHGDGRAFVIDPFLGVVVVVEVR
jgi:hypothetical protein